MSEKYDQTTHRHSNTNRGKGSKLYSSFNTCTKINFGGQRTLCKIRCVKSIGENEGKKKI